MSLTAARSVSTAQTLDDGTWQTAFDAGDNGHGMTTVEVECASGTASCRINGGTAFRVDAGQTKYRRPKQGVRKLEFQRQTTPTTVLWSEAVG